MKQLIVLCGISCSGKSTLAKSMWNAAPLSTIVVNRDKIRELLYCYTEDTIHEYYHLNFVHLLEEKVTEYEDLLIETALSQHKTVIVDATHLKPKYLKRFNKYEIPKRLEFVDITLKEALIRNKSRKRQVDEDVIIKQYNSYVDLRKELKRTKHINYGI